MCVLPVRLAVPKKIILVEVGSAEDGAHLPSGPRLPAAAISKIIVILKDFAGTKFYLRVRMMRTMLGNREVSIEGRVCLPRSVDSGKGLRWWEGLW